MFGESYDTDDKVVTDKSLSTFNAQNLMKKYINYVHAAYKMKVG